MKMGFNTMTMSQGGVIHKMLSVA